MSSSFIVYLEITSNLPKHSKNKIALSDLPTTNTLSHLLYYVLSFSLIHFLPPPSLTIPLPSHPPHPSLSLFPFLTFFLPSPTCMRVRYRHYFPFIPKYFGIYFLTTRTFSCLTIVKLCHQPTQWSHLHKCFSWSRIKFKIMYCTGLSCLFNLDQFLSLSFSFMVLIFFEAHETVVLENTCSWDRNMMRVSLLSALYQEADDRGLPHYGWC